MNGEEIKLIFEQLDERGKRHVEVIAKAELKHAREGRYLPHEAILNAEAGNLSTKGEKRQ